MRFTFKDGGMHIMFIKDIEEEIEMFKGEGYVEVKEQTGPHSVFGENS